MKQLIINADDLGYDPAVTAGIVRCMREGVVSSTTFMVNTPFSEEAAAQAQGLAVGLHLNLARHAPLSAKFPRELLMEGELSESLAAQLPTEVVQLEVKAQLDRLQRLLGRAATHVDVHKHLHRHPQILDGLAAVAKARGLPVRSIDGQMRTRLMEAGVRTNPHFIGDAGAEAYWTLAQLEEELARIPEGLTELMCHPGHTPTRVKSGYGKQREVELATFLNPDAWKLIEKNGIEVVDFKVLGKRL